MPRMAGETSPMQALGLGEQVRMSISAAFTAAHPHPTEPGVHVGHSTTQPYIRLINEPPARHCDPLLSCPDGLLEIICHAILNLASNFQSSM